MAIQNKVLIGAFSMAMVLATATAIAVPAMAEGSTDSGSGIVEKLASKFNLKQEDVKAVFDEDRQQHQAEKTAELSQNLQKAVDAGKITSEQKTLIESKLKENQTTREAEIDGLKTWADQQGVDMRYVMGKGHGRDNNLDSAVSSGKITVEQKTAIEGKQAEIEKAHEAKRDAMDQWAKDNGIDMDALHDYMGTGPGGPGHGNGEGRHLE